MTEAAKLTALAERCESAMGPSRELDQAIFEALGIEPSRWDGVYPKTIYPHYAYSASLDAALSLVPEGWGFNCEHDLGYGTQFTVGHVGPNKLYDMPDSWAQAATPALALTAAALKARASQEQGQ